MTNYIENDGPKYTLPFEISDMEFVKENQKNIRVCMEDLRFPIESNSDKEQIKAAMIYFRNTGYSDLNLDFRGCTPGMIVNYLIEYITTQFEVKNAIFSEAWLGIISDDENSILLLSPIPIFLLSISFDIFSTGSDSPVNDASCDFKFTASIILKSAGT